MADPPRHEYLTPYRRAVEHFGPGFEATLWGSREAQAVRFDVMIELAGFEGCAVLDLGCGQGDFAHHLLDRSVGFSRYLGVDALPPLIEAARRRDLPRCEFRVADAVADPSALDGAAADWVCICGTLNTMDEPTARRLVARAAEAASRGVVFNFLSSRVHPRWSDRDLGPARRFDPLRWLDFALSLSSRVAFTQAYLDGHDGTVLIRHD